MDLFNVILFKKVTILTIFNNHLFIMTLFLFFKSKDCPDGIFFRAQGICKSSKLMPQSNDIVIKATSLYLYG